MDRRTPKRLEKAALWNYALRVLGGRAHSVSELRDKLSRRAERQADVDDALSRLKEYGYLDDKRLAESYAVGLPTEAARYDSTDGTRKPTA